jgi:hypothetical protein
MEKPGYYDTQKDAYDKGSKLYCKHTVMDSKPLEIFV